MNPLETLPDEPWVVEAIKTRKPFDKKDTVTIPGSGVPRPFPADACSVAFCASGDCGVALTTILDLFESCPSKVVRVLMNDGSPVTTARNVLVLQVLSSIPPSPPLVKMTEANKLEQMDSFLRLVEPALFAFLLWGSYKLPPVYIQRLKELLTDWEPPTWMHFSPESLTAVRHAMGLWLAALNGGPGYLAPMTTTELLMKLGTYAFGRGQVAKWMKQSLSELMADDFLSLVIIQENSGFDDMVDRFSKYNLEMTLPLPWLESEPGSWEPNPLCYPITDDGQRLSKCLDAEISSSGHVVDLLGRTAGGLLRDVEDIDEAFVDANPFMLLHPLIIPITYLSKCGQALWAMVDSGRLEVHMDAGDICTLPARLPQHLLGVFDVVDTTNVGDYLTPLAVLSAMGTLVKPGTGQVWTEVLVNCSMWTSLRHQLEVTCRVKSMEELEGVTGLRCIGGTVIRKAVFLKPHPAEQYRLEYADLDAFLSALLVHTVAPPCGANMPVRGLPMLSVHPLSLGGFYRIIHSLVTVLGYPAHWFAKYFQAPLVLRHVTHSTLLSGTAMRSSPPLTRKQASAKAIPVVRLDVAYLEQELLIRRWAPAIGIPLPHHGSAAGTLDVPTTTVQIPIDSGLFGLFGVEFGRIDNGVVGALLGPSAFLTRVCKSGVGALRDAVVQQMVAGTAPDPANALHLFSCLSRQHPRTAPAPSGKVGPGSFYLLLELPRDAYCALKDAGLAVQLFSTMTWIPVGTMRPLSSLALVE